MEPVTRRIRLVLEYDGTAYAGWQVQPGQTTIQGEIERVLAVMEGAFVRLTASGRTDAGVHALGQVAHFDTARPYEAHTWLRAINAQIPQDIRVRAADAVSGEFHARYSAVGKHYRYRLARRVSAFGWRHAWHVPGALDVAAMRDAALLLTGEHDFSSFRASDCEARSAVRRIHTLTVREAGDELIVDVVGSGFLKQMARNITGALVAAGRGKDGAWLTEILAARDRRRAPETAPAWGLCLVAVGYPPPFGEGVPDPGPAAP